MPTSSAHTSPASARKKLLLTSDLHQWWSRNYPNILGLASHLEAQSLSMKKAIYRTPPQTFAELGEKLQTWRGFLEASVIWTRELELSAKQLTRGPTSKKSARRRRTQTSA